MTPIAQSKIYPNTLLGVDAGVLYLSINSGVDWNMIQGTQGPQGEKGDKGDTGHGLAINGVDTADNIIAMIGVPAGQLWVSTTTIPEPNIHAGDGLISTGDDHWFNIGLATGWTPRSSGDGTNFLSDDGTYKPVTGGSTDLDTVAVIAMIY